MRGSSSGVLVGHAAWGQASTQRSEPSPTLQLTPGAQLVPLLFSTASTSSSVCASTGGRQRLDVAERFNSLLSSLQCRLDSLGAATAGSGDAAAGLCTPLAAGPWHAAAAGSPPDTLDGGAAAAAATPDSVAWLPGMGTWLSSAVPQAAALPFGSPGTPAHSQETAAVASTQTDPPAVPAAVYMRAKPGGETGTSAVLQLIPRLPRLVVAYMANLLLFPLNRLLFNRLSAAFAAGGKRAGCQPELSAKCLPGSCAAVGHQSLVCCPRVQAAAWRGSLGGWRWCRWCTWALSKSACAAGAPAAGPCILRSHNLSA